MNDSNDTDLTYDDTFSTEEENVIMSSQGEYDPPFVSLRRQMAAKSQAEGKSTEAPAGEPQTTKTSPKHPSEWSCDDVKNWALSHFNESVAEKFTAQEVDGVTLLSEQVTTEESMTLLGLGTIGRKAKFVAEISKLKGHPDEPQIKQPPKRRKLEDQDRVLSNKEKDGLTTKERSLYNTKKKRIVNYAKQLWPEDKPTPSFRTNLQNSQKLLEVGEKLEKDNYYVMPEASLGKNAIMDIIRRYMMERRRKDRDPILNTSTSTDDTTEDSDASSFTSSSPILVKYSPPEDSEGDANLSKVKTFKMYFKEGLTLPSAHAILLKYLGKKIVRDLKMQDLKNLARKMELKLLRNKDKDTHILAIASNLIATKKVKLPEDIMLSRVTQDDVGVL